MQCIYLRKNFHIVPQNDWHLLYKPLSYFYPIFFCWCPTSQGVLIPCSTCNIFLHLRHQLWHKLDHKFTLLPFYTPLFLSTVSTSLFEVFGWIHSNIEAWPEFVTGKSNNEIPISSFTKISKVKDRNSGILSTINSLR